MRGSLIAVDDVFGAAQESLAGNANQDRAPQQLRLALIVTSNKGVTQPLSWSTASLISEIRI